MKLSATALIALMSLTTAVVEARVGGAPVRGAALSQLKKDDKDDDDDKAEAVSAAEGVDGLPALQISGNDGDFDTYPLELCMGECDNDADCADGLICFQRDEGESVPGCQDGGPGFESRGDYCISMSDESTPDSMSNSTESGPVVVACTMEMRYCPDGVTAMEQGPDCEWMDDMCPEPVVCTMEMAYCPGGTLMERDPADCRWMDEMCPATTAPTEIAEVEEEEEATVDGTSAPTEEMEGDASMAIMADERDTMVPEEDGDNGDMGDDATGEEGNLPSLSVEGQDGRPARAFPLGMCEGDCDNDDECGEGLVCLERGRGDNVPGCTGMLDVTTDFCVLATVEEDGVEEVTGTMVPSSIGSATGSM